MAKRLFIAVLGKRHSGKSWTWNELFGRKVNTGDLSRELKLSRSKCVEVFLISGSLEERGLHAEKVFKNVDARIVLCSIQYVEEGRLTFEYALKNGFDVYVQWLNPGYDQGYAYFDALGFSNQLLIAGASVSMRNGDRNALSKSSRN